MREERRYLCQNWRADVSVVVTNAGRMVEWLKSSAYNVPIALPCGDTESDTDYDLNDLNAITGSYDIRKDTELDGDVDANDVIQAGSITRGQRIASASAVLGRRAHRSSVARSSAVKFNSSHFVGIARLQCTRSRYAPFASVVAPFYGRGH